MLLEVELLRENIKRVEIEFASQMERFERKTNRVKFWTVITL